MKKIKLYATFILVALCTAIFVSCDSFDYPDPMVDKLTGVWVMTQRTEIVKIDGVTVQDINQTFNASNARTRFNFNSDTTLGIEGDIMNEANAAIKNMVEQSETMHSYEYVSTIWRSAGNEITTSINYNVEVDTPEGLGTIRLPMVQIYTLVNPTTLVLEITGFFSEAEEDTVDSYAKWVLTKVQ